MKVLTGLLVLLTMLVCAVPASAEQDKLILSSIRDRTKDSLSVMLTEDPRGLRTLRVYLPAGGNVRGQTPESIRAEQVSVQAFNNAGTELVLTALTKGGPIPGICNAGSCDAIAHHQFAVPNAALDQLRRVIVVFKGKRYEMTLTKSVAPGGKP